MLIVGDVMIDSYIWGKVERISPEAPVPVVSVLRREIKPGGAANVALNISNLGAEPLMCAIIGADQRGNDFLKLMSETGISTDGILTSNERVTTTKFRIIGNNMQMLRVDEETDHDISDHEFNKMVEKITAMLTNHHIDVIILQDYDKGVLSPNLIRFVMLEAQKRYIPVAVDPKHRHFMDYRGAKLFKPNFKELREGTRKSDLGNQEEAIIEAMDVLIGQQHHEMVLVTLGDKGMILRQYTGYDPVTVRRHAHIRHIADVSGAGDTVISVAAVCLAAGADPETMVYLSNLAGGMVCEFAGVVPIDKEKLLQEAISLYSI